MQRPRRQLPDAGNRPCRRIRDGWLHPGRQHLQVQEPCLTTRSWAKCWWNPSPACCARMTRLQEGCGRLHQAPDQGRLAGQAVRQVVHAARAPANVKIGLPLSTKPPRLPGPTPTTSPWKTTPRSNSWITCAPSNSGFEGAFLLGFKAVAPTHGSNNPRGDPELGLAGVLPDTIEREVVQGCFAKAATSLTWTGCCRSGAGRCLYRCWLCCWRWSLAR